MFVCVQKSKAETDVCKGQLVQLETRLSVDRKDNECEIEALAVKLMQKTEVCYIIYFRIQ